MDDKKTSFDDLILDKSNKSEKIKKILLRVIALVILFLVVMIVMKLINGGESEEKIEEALTPPDVDISTNAENPNAFNNLPLVDTNSNSSEIDQFEMLRRQMQGEDNTSTQAMQTDPEPLPPVPQTPPVPEPTIVEATKPQSQTPSRKEPSVVVEDKKPAKTTNKENPKPATTETKKTTTKPESKQTQTASAKNSDPKDLFKNVDTQKDGLKSGTYIQIFSVSKFDPKSKELTAIKENGYEIKLYKTEVNGKEVTRVLVGPFSNDTINAEMEKVRKNIREDAFVYRIK
ncbi:SPOR domain-containing protein [Campylobacter sp. MIT 99-7217]|uniref:SPOR domain-containing protein n=1 Tax=Campylobacter sp. MIT 99-7217 TaxID=535091 RepID=UPI00115B8F60|nr:SPOR domain-containing protein [Campylobacter sp. MIT 99-7217]TQR33089.1 SPOR domain-containing protein [Campylobacter sp. MIT 99-7217]